MKEKLFKLTAEQTKGVMTLLGWLQTTTSPKINITDSSDILKYVLTYGKYNSSQQDVLNELRAEYYKEVKNEELITW
jgi:hypothetical protein